MALLGPSGRKIDPPADHGRADHREQGGGLLQGKRLVGVSPGVSMVFQNFALFPWLTVRGNVLLPVGHLPEAEQQSRLEKVLGTVGLAHMNWRTRGSFRAA